MNQRAPHSGRRDFRRAPGLPHQYVYTRLRPSPIHGIGVFALRSIREGTHLFPDDNSEMVWIGRNRLRGVPKAIRRLYDDFAVLKKGRYGCPKTFNDLTMAWYLNEPKKGDRPNVRCDPETYEFYALRNIRSGEELTVDYETFSEMPRSTSR